MADQLNICIPIIIEISFEIVVLPVTWRRMPVARNSEEVISYEFVPDRRLFTFRLLGKPSLGQSPPVRFAA